MTRSPFIALVLVAALAGGPGVGRAEPPPAPPQDHPPRVVEAGSAVLVRPLDDAGGPPVSLQVGDGGGVYLDLEAAAYQVELRRWGAVEKKACQDLLDAKPPPGLVWVIGALVLGAAAGYAAARSAK